MLPLYVVLKTHIYDTIAQVEGKVGDAQANPTTTALIPEAQTIILVGLL